MNKKHLEALKIQRALFKRARKALGGIVANEWLLGFEFTRQNGMLDRNGIDLVLSFRCNTNGGVGTLCAQQKPNMAGVKKHLVKHPRVPVYILTKHDRLELIELTFLTLMLECDDAHNVGKKLEIFKRQSALVNKFLKGLDHNTVFRVFLSKRDYCEKIGKKIK